MRIVKNHKHRAILASMPSAQSREGERSKHLARIGDGRLDNAALFRALKAGKGERARMEQRRA